MQTKEERAAYAKAYREKNREKINARRKQKYDERGSFYDAVVATRRKHSAKRSEYTKNWAKKNPEKRKATTRNLRFKKYGLTADQYAERLLRQNNLCAMCFQPFGEESNGVKKAIDHCHKTGKVRGIIHGRCNLLLGHADDMIEKLEQAITYLKTTNDIH